MIGKIVGNYKILEALGEGGVGMVYKGVDTMLDREVAIKVLRPELASQTSVVERFRSEAVTLAKLSHPNIATLFSLFRQNDDLFMVMEFVRGASLETIIQKRGRLPVEETIPVFCQALDGINHAHEVGIIHRDIKPSNMILTETKTLKVLDFGIARLLGTTRMTRVGNIIGTLEYMSPEQVRGEETDARSDIYALGMMLYEVLTGKLPFETDNEFALMKMQIEEMPAPPRQLNPDIPVEIEDAIMRAAAKNPNERFQNAGEFLQTLLSVDLPLAAGNQFGFGSLFHAKFNTRPSKPGLEKTEQFSNADALTAAFNNEPEITEKFSNVNAPTNKIETPAVNKTTEFVPNAAENQAVNLQNQPTEILPDISSAVTEVTPAANPEIKSTRLGAFVAADILTAHEREIKPTRLGGVMNDFGNNYEDGNAAASSSASFLDNLTWVHYAGAGAAAFVLLTVVGLAASVPFLFSGGSNAANANTAIVETENKIEPAAAKPETESDVPETSSLPPSDSGTSDLPVLGENVNTNIPVDGGKETPGERSKERDEAKGKKPVEDKKNNPKPDPPKAQPPKAQPPKAQPPKAQPPKSSKTPKSPKASGTPDLTVN